MPPSPSAASRLGLLLTFAGLLCCALASLWAGTAKAATPTLEVAGGVEARSVELRTCPSARGKAAGVGTAPRGCQAELKRPYLGGRLTLLVSNPTAAAKELKVSYRLDDTPVVSLPGKSRRVFLLGSGDAAPGSELRVKPGQALSLPIGFAVPAGEPAAAVDGKLVVASDDEKPLVVPVAGAVRTFKGITVSPATLPMDSEGGTAEVTLAGAELVEYLRTHAAEAPTATLYGDGSDTTTATLELPSAEEVAESGNPSRAVATVTLSDASPAPGKYTGKLSLSDLSAESPSLTVELHSHRSLPLLVLLALLGVVVTGVGSRLVTTAARRRQLSAVLEQTWKAYRYVLCHGSTASWRLEDMLGRDPCGEQAAPPKSRLQGLAALEQSIATARSGSDLDEDAGRVLDMIARMQRWLRVEPAARRLALVARLKPPASAKLNGTAWADSRTLRDTRTLLEMARREPADPEKADDLVARLLFQARLHNAVVAIWGAAVGNATLTRGLKALEKAVGEKSAASRSPAEQDALAARLDGVVADLPDGTTIPPIETIPGEPPDGELPNGISRVRWDASSNLFTGWATLDAPSYGQLSRQAATSARALYMPGTGDLLHEVKQLRAADAYWTLAILAIASAAYGAAAYDDTWGSCQDLITAFLAGALGKVAVNWAALPIFQSLRLRKAKEG